jgi:hypothetical protein
LTTELLTAEKSSFVPATGVAASDGDTRTHRKRAARKCAARFGTE